MGPMSPCSLRIAGLGHFDRNLLDQDKLVLGDFSRVGVLALAMIAPLEGPCSSLLV